MTDPQIVAAGGALLGTDADNVAIARYILDACGKAKPRVCFVPTASGDDSAHVANFFESHGRFGIELGVLRFFRRTPAALAEYLADFDVVHIGGGNTSSMLAVWRHWHFDTVLREAWQRGAVLCGSSAGSICWFDCGLTDSVAGRLEAIACLGFLAGSNCPHYDAEPERRPAFRRAIADGTLADGHACDDGAALHFSGTALKKAVAWKPSANAFHVARQANGVNEATLPIVRLG